MSEWIGGSSDPEEYSLSWADAALEPIRARMERRARKASGQPGPAPARAQKQDVTPLKPASPPPSATVAEAVGLALSLAQEMYNRLGWLGPFSIVWRPDGVLSAYAADDGADMADSSRDFDTEAALDRLIDHLKLMASDLEGICVCREASMKRARGKPISSVMVFVEQRSGPPYTVAAPVTRRGNRAVVGELKEFEPHPVLFYPRGV
jgi:hypothetical protein